MNTMKQEFRDIFSGNESEDFGENKEVRAYCCGDRNVYFLLAPEDGGRLYRLEFWIDTYARNRGALQRRLQMAVDADLRHFQLVSYYSAVGCRLRDRITNIIDLREDVKSLDKAVEDIVQCVKLGLAPTAKDSAESLERVLRLPCVCSLSGVAAMLSLGAREKDKQDKTKNRLTIPAVQRGKVWNAARIETLWDSIFRDIPIGALSVRKQHDDERALDLLDGQQRASAISLGYCDFPNKNNPFDSILWIDLKEKRPGTYGFYVTTASQPWGYADSANETKNALLPLWERRKSVSTLSIELIDDQVKPYTFQMFPVRATMPVPYTMLRQYAEIAKEGFSMLDFVGWVELKFGKYQWLKNLSAGIERDSKLNDSLTSLCERVLKIARCYSVVLLDATSVAESDIALYFSRIGKGGVVPSDEELAYSVLKAKLDSGEFKTKIESIHAKYGIASQSRIAHIAIRFFKSTTKEKIPFYNGSVFSAVVEICKEEKVRKEFIEFVKGEFERYVKLVYDKTQTSLTQWHLTRYAKGRNGDVFLLLLIAKKLMLFSGFNLDGIAELIFCYASHTDYAIRKILEEGLQIGLAGLLKDTYYNAPRLTLPPDPSVYDRLNNIGNDVKKIESWKIACPAAALMLSQGYSGSPHDRSLSVLIYACRNSKLNRNFDYNPELGVWSEETCPWDYDHIMPHSTIEKMENHEWGAVCGWLKDSIGNLAPIPFRINRSLSDSPRDDKYPFCGVNDGVCDSNEQKALDLVGTDGRVEISHMWNDGVIMPMHFARLTISRFSRIYSDWYVGLGLGETLDFKRAFAVSVERGEGVQTEVIRRQRVYSQILEEFKDIGLAYRYIADECTEIVVPDGDLDKYLASERYITLSVDLNGLSIAVCRERNGGNWEVGYRKRSDQIKMDDAVQNQVNALIDSGAIEGVTKSNSNSWWYLRKEFETTDEVAECILGCMKNLFECWKEGCQRFKDV